MKFPSGLCGDELVRALVRLEYRQEQQSDSHVRRSLPEQPEHHVTIPLHSPLRIGIPAAMFDAVANRMDLDRPSLLEHLFR